MNTLRWAWPARYGAVASMTIFTGLLGAAQPAAADFIQQGPKLFGSGGALGSNSNQGSSVAISANGNTMIEGDPEDNGSIGAVWVFTRSGGVWTQQGSKIVPPGNNVGDSQFGFSVALSGDGNTAVIGGDTDNNAAGAVWVFTQSGGVWTEQGPKLIGSGATGPSSTQGASVAISADGNTLIEGGPNDNNGIGAAWVFTRSGGVWTPQGGKLTPGGASFAPFFGNSVGISGDSTAVIGGPGDNAHAGAVWVFTQSGGNWTQQGSKPVGSGAVSGPPLEVGQGFAVALFSSGNTLIEGSPRDNNGLGAAWVFTQSGGVWTQQGPKLVGTGAVGAAGQGISVALSGNGNTAIIGGSGDNSDAGAVWAFAQRGGVWFQEGGKLVGTGAVGTAFQGGSVALSGDGNTAVAGGSADNSIGAVWVFANHFLSATHDFNGDNQSDILFRDTAGDIGMWLMNGASIAQAGVFAALPVTTGAVGQRDFVGAGDAGILWRDSSGDLIMWLMNGMQIANLADFFGVPTNWSVVGTGDFNNDGHADILWRDNLGNVGVWFMNGGSILSTATLGNMPTQWVVAAADMNGDIFCRNTATGDVAMWEMVNGAIFQSVDFGVVPLTWSIAGIGDFAGTGSMDLLWRDTSGNVGIWLMSGTQIVSTKVLGMVPLTWSIVQTGDYGGSGMSDILWMDNVGDIATWFMNGTTITSVAPYGNIGISWTVQSLNAD